MQSAARKYLQTQVNTTSQGDLLILLYDGAITFLGQAKAKIKERDYAAKGILISKALDIINELASSLNKDKGGALAENLSNLYFLCNSKLLTANLKLDTGLIDEVVKILSGLRDAYAQIIRQGAAAAPAMPGPRPASAPVPPPTAASVPAAPAPVAPQAALAPSAPAIPPEGPPAAAQPTEPAAPPQGGAEAMRRRLMNAYGQAR